MVKAVHSKNQHFDDESLYREIKIFALDQLLGDCRCGPFAVGRLHGHSKAPPSFPPARECSWMCRVRSFSSSRP
jgi:hypothetical protein